MDVPGTDLEIPTWFVWTVVAVFVASLLYGLLVMRSPLQIISMWFSLVGIALSITVVYLFFRFVLAVEQIAEKL